ncbi:L-rhamnose isomerase [Shigella flexneri]
MCRRCCCTSASTSSLGQRSRRAVLLDDETQAIASEGLCVTIICLTGCISGLDFFDASINRIAAWVIRTRKYEKSPAACVAGTYR